MALFDEKDEKLVKAFLFNKIEKECDADPAIMTDYIMVTLQNNMSEADLKTHCKSDLTEFFGAQTNSFVDSLFDALNKRQYLPAPPAAPVPEEPEQPSSSLAIKGSSAGRPPANGHSSRSVNDRLGSGRGSRRRSRSPINDRLRYDRRRSRSPSREREAPRREAPQGGQQMLNGPLQPQGFPDQQQQQQMMMMAGGRRPKACFEYMRTGRCSRSDTCRFAHVTAEQAQMMGMPVPPNMMPGVNPQMMAMNHQQPGAFFGGRPVRPQQPPQHQQQQQQQQQQWGQQQGGGRPPANYSGTAVFVKEIPPEHMNEGSVREFFGRFGQVQSVRLDFMRKTATVDFGDNQAQAQALNTPEAIFNNRFVRVYKAHAQPSSEAAGSEAPPQQPQQQQQQQPVWRPKSAAIKKAELLEKYVEQQKELMKKLATPDMPANTRRIIMDSIKQIQHRIDATRNPTKPQETPVAAESAPAAAEGASAESVGEQQSAVASEKAALQDKLQKLQEEAQRLGMRGRGRGRGGSVMRGMGGRGSMTLDKRPRTIVLRNVSQEAAEQLSSEMSQFGEVEHIDKTEDSNSPPFAYAVKFKARWEAEKALKAANSLDLFKSVAVEWEQ